MSDDVFASLNGARLTTIRSCMPYYGAWTADVVLAESTATPSAVTLVVGDLSLVGTVYRMASFAGSRSARVVGGKGGWGKSVRAKQYTNPAGIRRSMVLGDAANEVGESISLAADGTLGTAYVRESAPASRTLRLLGGPLWWVRADGVTVIGPRPTKRITSDFTVIGWSGKTGHFEIATEHYADWTPGNTFTAPTVSGMQTVSMVSLEQDNDGKLRLQVLATGGGFS